MEFDPAEFERVDKRLDEIKALKRKYGSSVTEVLEFLEKARTNYNKLVNSEQEIQRIKKEINDTTNKAITAGEELTAKRKQVANTLEKEIIKQLQPLGMPSCKFQVNFKDGETMKPNGLDEIEFYFSANAGEPLKPLSSIISGGEMSRFMLGLKCLMYGQQVSGHDEFTTDGARSAGSGQAPRVEGSTLVFDEIDTGIGGTMGLKLAEKMGQLGRSCQVIAVTHLPQIAAMGQTHFLIEKQESAQRTTTNVYPLDKDGRLREVARMVGGVGDSAIGHAQSLMNWANEQIKI